MGPALFFIISILLPILLIHDEEVYWKHCVATPLQNGMLLESYNRQVVLYNTLLIPTAVKCSSPTMKATGTLPHSG